MSAPRDERRCPDCGGFTAFVSGGGGWEEWCIGPTDESDHSLKGCGWWHDDTITAMLGGAE